MITCRTTTGQMVAFHWTSVLKIEGHGLEADPSTCYVYLDDENYQTCYHVNEPFRQIVAAVEAQACR